MAKSYLGIDIGYDSVKLAVVRRGVVKKAISAPMPLNLLRDGRITSTESMGELLRELIRKNHLRPNLAAVPLPGEVTYLRTTSMPRMNAEQLAYNIPFEFSDYITDELKNYTFDYAVLPPEPKREGVEEEPDEQDSDRLPLMVAAVPNAVIDDLRAVLRKAGLKLAKCAPAECVFLNMIRAYEAQRPEAAGSEYCILDLGFRAIRMYMFRAGRQVATRALDVGLSSLDEVIAEARGVDTHLAHTYLLSNFENVQTQDYCINSYGNIAVELMRALNFYRFSNPDSQLSGVWLCGGGAAIEPLRDSISNALELDVRPALELIPGAAGLADGASFVQAVSAALE